MAPQASQPRAPGGPSGEAAPARRGTRPALVGLLLVLALGGFVRVRLLLQSSPYVLHEDELIATRRAARMMETGDFHPHFFRYPSLTIYLTALGFGAAHLVQGESPSAETGELEPAYERPEIGLAGRFLMIVLSLGTMVLVGDLARRALDAPALLALAPLALLVSPRFLMMSWTYVNVDLVGAFVCVLTLWTLFATRHSRTLLARAVLPGLLTGLAVGSKYYLGLVGLPAACMIFGLERRLWLRYIAVIVATTVLGFLLSTPYSLLDGEFFVQQVLREIHHYASGHRGAEAEPGLEQLVYYLGRTASEFGWGPCLLGLLGIAAGLRGRPRETGLLLSFPLALLLFLSTQRVHFIRNFLGAYALFPIFIAFGLVAGSRALAARPPFGRKTAGTVAAALLAAFYVLTMPLGRIRIDCTAPADSRNLAVAWIREHEPAGASVLAAEELMLDVRELEGRYRVLTLPLAELLAAADDPDPVGEPGPRVFVVPEVERNSSLAKSFGRPATRLLHRMDRRFLAGNNTVPREAKRLLHLGNPALEIRTAVGP